MHDLIKINEPEILKLFLEKGVHLGGTPGFPPFLQLLCVYTKPFIKKYNGLMENKSLHFQYDVNSIKKTLQLLEEYKCDFSSPIWIASKKGTPNMPDLIIVSYRSVLASFGENNIRAIMWDYTKFTII